MALIHLYMIDSLFYFFIVSYFKAKAHWIGIEKLKVDKKMLLITFSSTYNSTTSTNIPVGKKPANITSLEWSPFFFFSKRPLFSWFWPYLWVPFFMFLFIKLKRKKSKWEQNSLFLRLQNGPLPLAYITSSCISYGTGDQV